MPLSISNACHDPLQEMVCPVLHLCEPSALGQLAPDAVVPLNPKTGFSQSGETQCSLGLVLACSGNFAASPQCVAVSVSLPFSSSSPSFLTSQGLNQKPREGPLSPIWKMKSTNSIDYFVSWVETRK